MKKKITCAVSMILAALMTASPVVSSMQTAFAKTPSDDSTVALTENAETGQGTAEGTTDDPDVAVSIAFDTDADYKAGDSVPISVDVSNNETSKSELRIYFWDYSEELPEDKDAWDEVLTEAGTEVTVDELADSEEMAVEFSDGNGTGSLTVVQEKEDENDEETVTRRYLKLEIPSGASAEFELNLTAEAAGTITLVPAMAVGSDEITFDAVQLNWEETEVPDDEVTAVLQGTYDANAVSVYSSDNSQSEDEYTAEEAERLTREYRREAAQASLAVTLATSWCSITPGTDHAYGSWATCEFRVDREGTISQGYCAEPNSGTPNGTFQAYELDNDQIKAILMFAPGGPLYYKEFWNTYGNNPATGGTDGNDAYSLAHACLGLEYSGQTTGLSQTDIDEIRAYIALCDVNYCKQQKEWDQYTAYIAYNSDQDVVWLEYNPNTYLDIKVSKTWVDGSNTVGIRPSSITVNLYRSTSQPVSTSGTPYKTVTLSASNNWSYTWEDLPSTSGNTTYYYTYREASVPDGYNVTYSGLSGSRDSGYYSGTITNTIEWYCPITVTKSWSDYSNDLGARPSSIKIGLYRSTSTPVDTSGTPYATVTLNASNNWTYTWSSLLKQSGNTKYNYSVKELDLSDDYTSSQSSWSGNAKNGYSKTITNTLLVGYLKLHKDSSLPTITDGNGCYSLAGAEYTVYKTYSKGVLSDPVGTLTTQANGDTNTLRLLRHTYYIKETKAATGYELDNTVYTVTLSGSHTESAPYVLNVEDVPGNDPTGLTITKIWDGDETETVPTLEGTQFTIKYYDGYYTKDNLPGTATKTWVFEIKKNSTNHQYQLLFTDTYLVKDLSDSLYYDGNGTPCLPYGTISIQETKPAAGYTLGGYLVDQDGNVVSTDSEIYVAQITKESGSVQLQGGNEFTGYNTPIYGSIKIKKYGSNGSDVLEGVTFEIKDSSGNVVSTATTDGNGEAVFEDLYPDVYTVTETKTVNGHSLLEEPFTVEVPTRVTEVYIKENNIDMDKVIYDEADDIYYIHNFTYEVSNSATFQMPTAGSSDTMGTYIPLFAGFALIAAAGVFGIYRKRRS